MESFSIIDYNKNGGAANKKGLKISGGSDYHGTNKKHLHLGMLNKEDKIIAEQQLTILNVLV